MYIPIGDNDEVFYSEDFVVRFTKANGIKWVANFQRGWTNFSGVFELTDTTSILIVAYGSCYLINPNETKAISVFGSGYASSFEAPDGRIILQDQTDFTIVEKDGKYWHSERISWDGLKELNFNKGIISGLAYDPMGAGYKWVKFSYNLDTKKLIGGSYVRQDSEN
jgi:hypothetical protein